MQHFVAARSHIVAGPGIPQAILASSPHAPRSGTRVTSFDCAPRLFRPRLFAALDARGNLRLKGRRPEREPLVADLIDEQPPVLRAEPHQPIQRFPLRALAGHHRDIDRQAMPQKVRSQQDHVGPVGSHPVRERTRGGEPSADEFPARMLRAVRIDRAVARGAERARSARPHLVPAHLDLEPAVATRRAASAVPVSCFLHLAQGCRARRRACSPWGA